MNNRPFGISILSIWFGISGFSILILQVLFTSELTSAFSTAGAPALASMIFLAGVGILSIAAAVTFWLGKRVGWWLGIAHIALSTIRNAWAIFMAYQLTVADQVSSGVLPRVFMKHGLRVCISFALIYYLFRPNVLVYFQRGKIPSSA